MRGFQPAGRASHVQSYADGGVVGFLKRAVGLAPKLYPSALDEQRQQQQQAQQRQPSQDPQPQSDEPKAALSQYSGMSALKRRMKDVDGYANGGPVRGKGTGTSDEVPDRVPSGTYIMPADSTQTIGEAELRRMGADSPSEELAEGASRDNPAEESAESGQVPVNLSKGEFKLPPEQVHAIGVQTLDQMKNATHTPVTARGFAPGAQQQPEPPLFFADGGVVNEEEARRRAALAPGLAVDASPENAARFVQVPSAIVQQPGRQMPQAVAQPAAPATTQTTPASATPTSAGFMPGVRGVFNESGKALGDLVTQGRYGAAAGETVRAGLAYVPALADDVIGGAVRAVGPGVMDAGRQLLGMNVASAAPVAVAAPASTSTGGAPPPAPTTVTTPQGPAALNSAVESMRRVAGAPAVMGSLGTQDATQIAPGVFRSGNSYSDTAANAATGAAPRGLPSPQNVAAADALAQRSQQESLGRIAAQATAAPPQTAGFQTPIVRHSGNDWQARNDLRNLQVSAGSITNRPEWRSGAVVNNRGRLVSGGGADPDGKVAAYLSAVAADQALRKGQSAANIAAMHENAGLQREALREQGLNARGAAELWARGFDAAARRGLEERRFGLDERVKNIELDAAQRQQKLYDQYAKAKTTEERTAIAQQIRDLAGKQTESPWKIQVTPATKNVDGSTTDGSIYRYNMQTGVVERVDAGGTAQPTGMPKPGETRNGYRYKGGNPNVQANWEKV